MTTKINACKACKNSVLYEGMCLGLALDSSYKKLIPVVMHSPLLKDWIVKNSVHNAKIENENCNCESFIKVGHSLI